MICIFPAGTVDAGTAQRAIEAAAFAVERGSDVVMGEAGRATLVLAPDGREVSRSAARFAWRFTKIVFVYIHSEERLICLTDTAAAVFAVYFLVSDTLLAMLAAGAMGLVFGVLNYEIVSVRWLKLVPARVRK